MIFPKLKRPKLKWNKLCQVLVTVYVIALCTFYLFYVEAEGYTVMDVAKQKAFYILHDSFLGLIAACLLVHTVKTRKLDLRSVNLPTTLATAYLLLVWASAISSVYWPTTIQGLTDCEGALKVTVYVLAFLAIVHYGKPPRLLLWVVSASLMLYSAFTLVQMLGYNPLSLYQEGTSYEFYTQPEHPGQFSGTIGNSNLVALFLVLCILCLTVAYFRTNSKLSILLIAPALLSVYVLFRLQVALGAVGLIGGLLMAVPIAVKRKRRLDRFAVSFGIVCTFLTFVYFIPYNQGTLYELHELLHGRAQGDFGSGRLYAWTALLQDMQGHWLLGHGPDTVIASAIEPIIVEGANVVGMYTDAHNLYLQILYCHGLPALLVFLALLLHAFIGWVRLSPKSNSIAILGAGVCGYCISAFFCLSHYITSPYFWCALGLLEAEISRTGSHR